MINMKVEFNENKIYVYLYQNDIDINNIENLNNKIKIIFIKIIKKYNLDLYGFNKVVIYHNTKYGIVLEIEKIYSIYPSKIIDLKIIIYKNTLMYLEFDDYYFVNKPKNLIIKNNKYYLNIDNIKNITDYIEYGKLIFKKNL